ncbi:MAG: hypothetical protein ETSY1_42480 [Candidatus Entotheonella factor]|uniref:Uncharacterized protein n=1 Tax=Entotheonella factor TaxID=1429438 RepID=W4L4U8_ENTF1|nr:MAG: hypothetical protein ETSY1_42480 [Candidatus Entotheonella factor]
MRPSRLRPAPAPSPGRVPERGHGGAEAWLTMLQFGVGVVRLVVEMSLGSLDWACTEAGNAR